MAEVKVFYDQVGNTLTVWFGNPQDEHVCEETGDYNYSLKRKPGGEKLRLKKYCPKLRKHTFHNEKKK